jgi:catechol 1,2-dioxygenase
MSDSRIRPVVRDLLGAIQQMLEKHRLTPAEYRAAVDFLHETGAAGEIPLLLDVFIEGRVVDLANRGRRGTPDNLLGPFYLEGAPLLQDGRLASAGEPGERLLVSGSVRELGGRPVAGALLDFWQSDARGCYSGIHPATHPMNLRGRMYSRSDGRYELHTVRPAPYTIPHDGPTGRLLRALGLHPWRPAHVHLKASREGYRPLTTQIYLADSDYLDSDAARAVRADLVRPVKRVAGGASIEFDVVLEAEG